MAVHPTDSTPAEPDLAEGYWLAFDEARRALEDQERSVEELRSRSGTLIAAAAIMRWTRQGCLGRGLMAAPEGAAIRWACAAVRSALARDQRRPRVGADVHAADRARARIRGGAPCERRNLGPVGRDDGV